MINEQVLIVGGGIAGLTAAIYAAKAGYKVTLFEKNDKCGGLVSSFSYEGFLFDGGTRALEGFLFPLLKDLEISLEYVKTPVSVGIEDTIVMVNSESGIQEYRHLLELMYPDAHIEIDKIFKPITKMGRFLAGVNRFLNSKQIERLYGLADIVRNIKVLLKMNTPMERYFKESLGITNQSLQDIILQHFFKGTPAFFALGYLYLYPDYIYTKGGTGTLAIKMEEKALAMGVNIVPNTPIQTVIPSEKIIIDENGGKHQYNHLIWAADLKKLYRSLDVQGLPGAVLAQFYKERERILKHKGAESIFTLFIAVDEEPEYFSRIASSHLFYTPSRKGLGALIREEQDAILNHWDRYSKTKILEWLEKVCRYNTFEIAVPVLKDPQAAPPHKTGLIVSFLFEYEIAKKAYDSGWYEELKEAVSQFIIKILAQTIYKGIDKKIIFTLSATPLSIEKISGSSEGAVIGWSMEQPPPVVNSMLKMKDSVKTAIPSILKAGQWTMSPAGIPTAVMTGQIAARMLKSK